MARAKKEEREQYSYGDHVANMLGELRDPATSQATINQIVKELRAYLVDTHEGWVKKLSDNKTKIAKKQEAYLKKIEVLAHDNNQYKMLCGQQQAQMDMFEDALFKAEEQVGQLQSQINIINMRYEKLEKRKKKPPLIMMKEPNKALERKAERLREELREQAVEHAEYIKDADRLSRHKGLLIEELRRSLKEAENKYKGLMGTYKAMCEQERNKNAKAQREIERLKAELAKPTRWQKFKQWCVEEFYRSPPWADK